MPDLALLAGIPSVGKSRLVRYAAEQEALAINMEAAPNNPHSLESAGLRAVWNSAASGDLAPLMDALNCRPEPQVLLEWGFPLHCLPLVRQLHLAGITTWWLDGDAEQARVHHQRAGKTLRAFDLQMAAIWTHRIELDEFLGDRKIVRLLPDGTFVPDEDVFRVIFPTRAKDQNPVFPADQNPS